MPTLTDLYDQLEKHDWFYEMSDDHSVWTRGESAKAKLIKLANSLDGGRELMQAFTDHYYSGPPWGTEKKPKPQRP